MQPELEIGDIVKVKETDEELKKDNIISFRQGQNIITHRIEEVVDEHGQKKYQTKGDNNNKEDDRLVNIEDIEGKVVSKIPFFGKAVLIMQKKTTIIIVVVVFYFYLLRTIKKNNKDNNKQ